jgi:hypothetical protein
MSGHHTVAILKMWPVPNTLFQLLLSFFMFVFNPIIAVKLFVILYLLFASLLSWNLSKDELGVPDKRKFLILITTFVIGSSFWNGYFNYLVGLLIFFFYVNLKRHNKISTWLETVLGVVIFFSHALPFCAFVIYVGWDSLLKRRLLRGFKVVLPSLLLLGWYFLANGINKVPIAIELHGFFTLTAYKFYTIAKLGPYQNFIVDANGDYERVPILYWIGVGINLAFALFFVIPLLVITTKSFIKRAEAENLTTIVCTLVFLVLPVVLFGVVNIGERVLLIAVIFALITVNIPYRLLQVGSILNCVAPLIMLNMVFVAGIVEPKPVSTAVIVDASQRFKLLFWHRSLLTLSSAYTAEIAAETKISPTVPLLFDTSVLLPR